MSFFRFFGFENVNFKITTERLGVAVFCAVLTIGSTFTPIIDTPHVWLNGYPSDLSHSRGFMLAVEVLGIGLNLINLRKWATIMLGVTLFELALDYWYAFDFTNSINESFAKDPTIHYTHHAGLSWGWWFIILGPSIMAFVLFRDYLRENP
jgi:hypothetical protein